MAPDATPEQMAEATTVAHPPNSDMIDPVHGLIRRSTVAALLVEVERLRGNGVAYESLRVSNMDRIAENAALLAGNERLKATVKMITGQLAEAERRLKGQLR